jgi:hypothetical protein
MLKADTATLSHPYPESHHHQRKDGGGGEDDEQDGEGHQNTTSFFPSNVQG